MSKAKLPEASTRLQKDYIRLKQDPVPYVTAEPLTDNILVWHYVVKGPEQSPYEGGYYHGKLVFPREFPFRPPSIYMVTPNGRFKTNTRLCLSISDFHPDTWNPSWSVPTILTALLSFMLESTPTMGSLEAPEYEKRHYAAKSLEYNLKNKVFCELFPEIVEDIKRELRLRAEALKNLKPSEEPTQPDPNSISQTALSSAISNIVVLVGSLIFAYIVKCVLRSLANE